MVASSVSWWLIEVAVELSTKRATADSGTSDVAVLASALPLDASRAPGLADSDAAPPAATVPLLLVVPLAVAVPPVVVAAAVVAATEAKVAGGFAAT